MRSLVRDGSLFFPYFPFPGSAVVDASDFSGKLNQTIHWEVIQLAFEPS